MSNTKKALKKIGGEKFLNGSDLKEFSKAEIKVYNLMIDSKWHTASEIISVSGQREGLRRLRELRNKGLVIETKREKGSRDFHYKLNA